MYYDNETYLQHFGVKGMKWGVRRTPEQLGHKVKAKGDKLRAKAEKINNSKLRTVGSKIYNTAKINYKLAKLGQEQYDGEIFYKSRLAKQVKSIKASDFDYEVIKNVYKYAYNSNRHGGSNIRVSMI